MPHRTYRWTAPKSFTPTLALADHRMLLLPCMSCSASIVGAPNFSYACQQPSSFCTSSRAQQLVNHALQENSCLRPESQNKFHYEKAKARPSADEELVDEFYANLTSNKLMEVSVQGIKVPITSNVINEFFELLDFEDDEYSSLMRNIEPENLQEILRNLQFQSETLFYNNKLKRVRIPKKKKKKIPEIEPIQSVEIPHKVEQMELVTELDMTTAIFRTQSPCLDLQDELSKIMDIMQHMQWQQQAY
ncbi:hypothetical protein PVK06_024380 [Gossypium arboreum]|uniref:Uncharacterized protein n=1 Tax=Gossypium arboreum TaxID=29729 RepID=A0ABR0PDW1_GOSAR|nr:hypothetical protein PVK06_024380 [Gossypium arboreum]